MASAPTSLASGEPVSSPSEHSRITAALVLLVLICAIALVLRLYGIAARGFWYDEGFSIMIARLRWLQFFLVLWNREANMSLYYVLFRPWAQMGSSEAFLRALSVLFSVATLPLIYALGARLFGRSAGLIAAWLLAINAYQVRYAQEARAYALMVFLSVLSTWLLARNFQQPSSARWGVYTAANVLLVYSHFFGTLVILAHCLSLLWLPRSVVPWRAIRKSLCWLGIAAAPLGLAAFNTGMGPLSWISPPNLDTVLQFFITIAGNRGKSLLVLDTIALGLAAFAGWNVWRLRRRSQEQSLHAWPYVLVFAWLFLPVVLSLIGSLKQPMFHPRYLIPCVPALLLAVGAGLMRLQRVLAVALLAAISVLGLAGTVAYYHSGLDGEQDDWRAASAYIFEHARPGDGIFFSATFSRPPFEYYRSRQISTPVWPVALYTPGQSEMNWKDFVFSPLAEVLRDSRPASDRVWVVFNHDGTVEGRPTRASRMVRAWYAHGRRQIDTEHFTGIEVVLFSRDPRDEGSATESRLSPKTPSPTSNN